jgi:DeoR family transcriptional regulator, copper-sensing transcriptional repressor
MQKKSPEQRRQIILERLQQAGRLSLDEIVAALGCSAMTANRDIRLLDDEGLVQRVHGAIIRPENAAEEKTCGLCHAPISTRVQFMIISSGGKLTPFCCPHCGLSRMRAISPGTSAFATDFIYGRMIPAEQSFYLVNSRVSLCCLPSVLAFHNKADALAFQYGFGGELYDLPSALTALYP